MLSVLGLSAQVPKVFAAGTVCIGPDLPAQTACPASTIAFTGPVTTGPSTQLRVQVFLSGSSPMNGADVVLFANPTVLNPVGVDLTGTLFPTGFTILAECINGALIAGSSCNAVTDVAGTIHVSIVGFSGALSPSGETGLIFTAIFDIVGASTSTTIGFQTNANLPPPNTGCSNGSVVNTCIRISDGTTTPVPVTSQTAGFSSTTTQGQVQLSPNGASLGTFFSGISPAPQTLTITDVGGTYLASGQADGGGDTSYALSTTIIGPTSTATGITASLNPGTPFSFASTTPGPFTAILTISSSTTATTGTWSVIVTGLYHFDPSCIGGVPGTCTGPASTLIQSVAYTITVVDFTVTVPSSATTFVPYWCSPVSGGVTGACPTGSGTTQTISIIPAGYTGAVTVATATGTPTPVTTPPLSVANSVTSIPGASGSLTVTFTNGVLRPATNTGAYTVRTSLTGTLPTGNRVKTLTWIVRPQNFNITTSNGTPTGPAISFASGGSATDTLTIGSLPSGTSVGISNAGFAGQVALSSTIGGGTGLTVTPATTPVTFTTAGGKLTDVVTFAGTVTSTTVFTVTITGTATLAGSIPSITQTQSVTYSVTITGTSHPTSTSVACTPSSVQSGQPTTCTATVTDTAASGATTPSGSVSFASSGAGTFSNSASCTLVPGVTGTASCSLSYTPSAVGTGTHTITGTYGGDSSHTTSHGTFALTVTPAISTVTITTTLASSSITVGGSVTDSAALSGNTASAGGTVTYSFFTGSTCGGTGTTVGTPVTVTSGVVPTSASQSFNAVGSFSWSASYSGDANNSPATSACEPLAVNQASPTISTTLSANPITVGGSVTDSATLTGGFQAGGTVTYSFFTGSTCSGTGTAVGAPVTVTGGVVPNSASQAFSTAGPFSWNAAYSGDANNKAATSACEPLAVNPLSGVTISTTLSSNPIAVGGSATDSASLAGATANAGGTVTYSFFTGSACAGTGTVVGSPVTVTAGVVPNSASQSFTSAGSFSWRAIYSGDANNNGATSACEPLTVNKASPTIATTLSSNPISAGGSVSDSATLSGGFQAGGTVTYSFFTGSTCAGAGTVVGTPVTVTNGIVPGSTSQTFPNAGPFSWNAAYSGDANNNAVTSACEPLTVNPASGAALSTSLSANPIPVGGSVTDSATLTGVTATAGGTVTYSFFAGSTCSGTGTAVGSPVSVLNGVVPNSASQTFNAAGSFSWNAIYSGDTNNAGATSGCEPLTVNKASPTITTSLASSQITVGGSVTDSATLSGGFQAGGTVTYNFFSGSTCGGIATPVGTAVTVSAGVVPNSASQAFNNAGSFSWNAAYSGDSNNNGVTSGCETLTVAKSSPSISTTLSANPINQGGSVIDSAALTNGFQASGTVTYSFFTGLTCTGTGTPVGSPVTVTNGIVPNSASQTFATAGSFSWNAVYGGDANNNGATSACEPLTVNTVSVVTISTTLSSSGITVGGSVTDSATLSQVTSTAGGTVTYSFFTGATCSGTGTTVGGPVTVTNGIVPSSGSQIFNFAGSFSWNAVYSGDANNAGATSGCEPLTVTQAAPTIATTVSNTSPVVGSPIHDSAVLTNGFKATGTVSYSLFVSGNGCTGAFISVSTVTVTAAGLVPDSSPVMPAPAGLYGFQASYSGDANNMAAVSACEPVTVLRASPTIATTLSSTQITAGASVTDSAVLSGGFMPFGTVSYNLFSTIDCSGTSSIVSTVNVSNGVVPSSASQMFSIAGSFGWSASYSGDLNNTATTSACEPLTVTPSSSAAITTSLSSTTITVGGSVFDTAKLSGVTANAGGTVTYSVFNGTVCGTGRPVGSPVTVLNGIVPNSSPMTFLFAATYSWNAAYSGDADNNAAVSACEPLTVNLASPTISTSLSASQINIGQSVTDSATLSNGFQAGGFVTYRLFSAGDCSGIATIISNVTVTNGVVPDSASRLFNTTGTFGWNAFYTGDGNNMGATSACEPLTVSSVTGAPFLLTFQAFNFSAFHNGIGPFTVLVNGNVVVVFPGHGFVSSTSTTVFGTDKWVSLGPYDITSFVRPGQNNVTFINTFGIRFSLIRNIMVTQGDTVFLNFKGPRFVSSNHPLTVTFSNPPLVITSFTVTGSLVTDSNVTFTATYTGGTGPFKCRFFFGDDEATFVAGGATSCSVTHDFDDSGNFTAWVVVIGSSTSDIKIASLAVTVTGSLQSQQLSMGVAAVSSDRDLPDD